jgi:hypothetical protein
MAITGVIEQSPRTGSIDHIRRDYSRQFLVYTDDPADDAPTVLASTLLPRPGDYHPSDPRSAVRSLDAQPKVDKEATYWSVTVRYESISFGSPTNREQRENPTDQPASVQWDTISWEEVAEYDYNKLAVVNSAGDKFSQPPTITRYALRCSIRRTEDDYDPLDALTYYGAINSTAFYLAGVLIDPGDAKLIEFAGSKAMVDGVQYWEVTYQVLVKIDNIFTTSGWVMNILDAGYNYLTPAPNQKHLPILNDDGTRRTAPDYLDENGAVATTARYIPFQFHHSKEFNQLNLQFA